MSNLANVNRRHNPPFRIPLMLAPLGGFYVKLDKGKT